jgi:nucleoside 2-deoxyribosyltransferase
MTVYIAAPYELREQANAVRLLLADRHIVCSSRWIVQDDSAIESHEWAQVDLDDIKAADVLVALNPPEFARSGSGGRHVELGYALALDKQILVVGARSNIFHHHHAVTICESIDHAVGWLQLAASAPIVGLGG